METMEITTIKVIISTSMVHQKLLSLVEMAMDPMEMAMVPMVTEMEQMEMVMDLMEMDPMVCAVKSPAQSVNQSGSQSARITPL